MPTPLRLSFGLPFREALDVAEKRRIVLAEEFYGRLQDEARLRAFTVAKLSSVHQIGQVYRSLQSAMAEGKGLAEWRKEILATWPGNGDLPTKAYLALVYRNNAQTSYTGGLWRQYQRNRDDRPFLMYSAINDARTRPAHRAMSGYVAHIDDAIWNRWTPPCGHSCRCTLLALTNREAIARGYGKQERPPVEPDQGFGARPEEVGDQLERSIADAVSNLPPVVRQAVEAREAVRPPILADAVTEALGGAAPDVQAHAQAAIAAGQIPARYATEATAVAAFLRDPGPVLSALRGDTTAEEVRRVGAVLAGIQQADGALPAFAGEVAHVVGSGGFPPGAFAAYLAAHTTVGSVVQWQAPTVADAEPFGEIHFTIAATRALDVASLRWKPQDGRVLFTAGAAFRVVSAQQVGGRWEVRLAQVSLANLASEKFASPALTTDHVERFRRQHGMTPWEMVAARYPQFREACERLGLAH